MVSIMSSKNTLPSQRLTRLVSLCGAGENLWDIGCDHGQAGLLAGTSGAFKHVSFVDPSSSVIQLLKDKPTADIPKGFYISILKGKGNQISVSSPHNVFLMAGFGGEAIIETLKHLTSQDVSASRFILSPHRQILAVRRFLNEGPWNLLHEEIIEENDQFYEAIVVEYRPGRAVSLFGEEQWSSPVGMLRRAQLLNLLPVHRNPQDQAFYQYLLSLQNPSNFT